MKNLLVILTIAAGLLLGYCSGLSETKQISLITLLGAIVTGSSMAALIDGFVTKFFSRARNIMGLLSGAYSGSFIFTLIHHQGWNDSCASVIFYLGFACMFGTLGFFGKAHRAR